MPKQIKADLDQVVEAVMEQFRKDGIVMAMYLDYGGDDINLVVDTPSGTEYLRTALEQFVVESNEAVMDSIEKIIEDMEESAIFYDKLLQYETSEAIRHFLTRLKALRENSNDKKEEDEHPDKNHKDR